MLSLTKLTAVKPNLLSKRYELENGVLVKSTAGALVTGRVERLSLDSPEDLAPLLAGLDPSQALMMGVPKDAAAIDIVTRQMLMDNPTTGSISRTGEHFEYPAGPGFLFIDHDGLQDGTYLSPTALISLLAEAEPELLKVKIIALPSSSSHICTSDGGKDLTGARGVHLYIPVEDARDIPRIIQVLFDRLWLGGHGYVLVAKNGTRLLRAPIDASVCQANRIVFAGGASCGDGLEQRRGEPTLVNPEGVDMLKNASAFQPLDKAEKELVEAAKEMARVKAKPQATATRQEWLATYRPQQMKAFGARAGCVETTESLMEALDNQVLMPDVIVMVKRTQDREFIATPVAEILKDRIGYNRALTLDPTEPDYNNRSVVGCLFLDGRVPLLHSQAHGGATYRLEAATKIIDIIPSKFAQAAEDVLEHIRQDNRFFDFGPAMVTITDNDMQVIDEHLLELMLGSISFRKPDRRGQMTPTDAPSRLLKSILSMKRKRHLRPLASIVDHPTMTAQGLVLDQPGYHAREKVFLNFDPADWPEIPDTLDAAQAKEFIKTIWQPFRLFPLMNAASRGAVLAGIFTTILRGSLSVAPAFASDAPNIASGKSLLLTAIASLGTGRPATLNAAFTSEDPAEMRKLITSTLMEGEKTLLFDDAEGFLHSPPLNTLLTSALWSDRILQTNTKAKDLPTRLFVGITGNNMSFSDSLQRRVIAWRLDTQMESPFERIFNWCPQDVALANRRDIVHAVLSLTNAAQKEKLPNPTTTLPGYKDWEYLVRRAVRYIEMLTDGYFADPVPTVAAATSGSESVIALKELYGALAENFSTEPFTAKDVVDVINKNDKSNLADAISGMTNRSEKLSSRSVGRYLAQCRDRPCGGLVLRVQTGGKSLTYHLKGHQD